MRLLRQRAQYWSNSKVADWLRSTFGGLEKPTTATWEEWQQYKADAGTKNKFIDQLSNNGLNRLQNIIYFPVDVLDAIRIYIINRFVDQTHILPTRLPVGEWRDTDTKLLHAAFEALVDFIECEKAWMEVAFCEDKNVWKACGFRWWQRHRWLRWTKRVRSPNAGLAYLAWELSLTEENPNQAAAAMEQLALYNWWRFTRPARIEPYRDELTLEQSMQLSQTYDQEDEEMLIRLVKIRRSLWT